MVYDFCESRAGENARAFLGEWRGSLVCDDYAGYKAGFAHGVFEAGCLAHARRKFFDLQVSGKKQVAESALQQIGMVYEVEREVQSLTPDERQRIRHARSRPLLDAVHRWMLLTRQKITDGSATAKALDYSLKRWVALTRFVDDGRLPVDNIWGSVQTRGDSPLILKEFVARPSHHVHNASSFVHDRCCRERSPSISFTRIQSLAMR